jgi:Spy/CpxP family protein refolding chaperone
MGGILFERHIIDKKPTKRTRRASPIRFPSLEMMAQELNLTSDQQEQIREIFKNNEGKIKKLRKDINQHFLSMRTQLRSEIIDVLSEEQKLKFEAMIKKYISQRKEASERRKKHSTKRRKDRGEKK